jgi:hypothetical protein
MGRPRKMNAYEREMERIPNACERTQCECGKWVDKNKLETHNKTDYHFKLLRLKTRE